MNRLIQRDFHWSDINVTLSPIMGLFNSDERDGARVY